MVQDRSETSLGGSDLAVLAELGRRFAAVRVSRNLTQEALAEEAGVSTSTVRRLEAGHSTQMTAFVRILRALRLLDNLEGLVPLPAIRPLQALERQGRPRRRASSPRRSRAEAGRTWVWGEDQDGKEDEQA